MKARIASDTMTRVARAVSIVAHPFVTALLLAGAVTFEQGALAAAQSAGAVALLVVLPLAVLTVWQMRRGAWSTVDASLPRERRILFLVGGAGLFALLTYFARTGLGTPFVTGTVGVLVMVGVCAAMTPWLKVSLHMATAALASTVLLLDGHLLGWMLAAVLPVLAWSRVRLGRHGWDEVVAGLVVGVVTGAAIVHVP